MWCAAVCHTKPGNELLDTLLVDCMARGRQASKRNWIVGSDPCPCPTGTVLKETDASLHVSSVRMYPSIKYSYRHVLVEGRG